MDFGVGACCVAAGVLEEYGSAARVLWREVAQVVDYVVDDEPEVVERVVLRYFGRSYQLFSFTSAHFHPQSAALRLDLGGGKYPMILLNNLLEFLE